MTKEILMFIPGFRSDKRIKKIVASIYYLFWILTMFMANSIGDIFISIMMMVSFVLVCGITDLLIKKEKRNLKSIGVNVLIPFVISIVCAIIVNNNSHIYDAKEEAARDLGISLSEYNSVLDKYKNMKRDYEKLKKEVEDNKLNYKNKQKEYESLKNRFEKYKTTIPESTIQELEDLKKDNENYKNKILDLESKISDLNNKLN